MFHNELVPIDLSHFLGVFVFPHLEDVENKCLHIDLAYALQLIYLCCANGVVNKEGHVIDDVLRYHAHTHILLGLCCVKVQMDKRQPPWSMSWRNEL